MADICIGRAIDMQSTSEDDIIDLMRVYWVQLMLVLDEQWMQDVSIGCN